MCPTGKEERNVPQFVVMSDVCTDLIVYNLPFL